MSIFSIIGSLVWAFLGDRAEIAAEMVALRHQLTILQHSAKRPKLRKRDRIFWVWLSKLWSHWRSAIVIVKPETVVRWHRQGLRLYWRCKPRKGNSGRPKIEREITYLIRRMSPENPTWGAPRIQSELRLLGYKVAESTVSKYLVRPKKPASQTWRTFLENHVDCLASIDFFTVPTATFRILYCFIVLRHERRRVSHFSVTTQPTQRWAAQQIVEAFPFDEAPRYMIRDRDGVYGACGFASV